MDAELLDSLISIAQSLTIIALSVIIYFQRKTITELEEKWYDR
jgi:hypothetical protein